MNEMERFKAIKDNISNLSSQKIRLEERFKNEKTTLEKLVKEITAKGYDPKKLTEIREKKEKQLQEDLTTLENQIEDIKIKLNSIEV